MTAMTKEGLESTNPQYDYHKSNWQMVRDLIKGKKALAQRDLGCVTLTSSDNANLMLLKQVSQTYLPMPDADDCSESNLYRYAQYVQRASLFNATVRTEKGMSGMVFSKDTEIDLPQSVAYLEDDADGSGVGIGEQAVEVLNNILETGRGGLYVDYPRKEGSTTVAEQEAGLVRASIIEYKAEQILDWYTISKNSKQILAMVKLVECQTVLDTTSMKMKSIEKTRVLFLEPQQKNGPPDENDGLKFIYKVRLYSSSEDFEEFTPVDGNGNPFEEIPFFFIGSVNNRPDIDVAPLLELAEINIAHYRNSADFEEAAFIAGQPTLVITGLTQGWVDKNFKNGVKIGSRSGLPLPKEADAKLLQPEEVTMSERGMEMKKEEMISVGARLVTDGGQAETAEAARIKHAADASVLSVVVKNINLAYKDAITVAIKFNQRGDVIPDYIFAINSDFFASKLSPQELAVIVQAWQGGAFDQATMLMMLKKGKIIEHDADLEAIASNAQNESGQSLNLDAIDEE